MEILSSNQKNKEIPMKCRVNSIDKIQKALILQVIEDTNANCLETNIQKTNDITTIAWIDLNKVVSSIHAIVEKGLSYNFMVERIAEAKGNYYYVIVIDNKECWIKMLPFEIYQNTKKNIIRCEYRGVDSYGSHIFIEDKLSILYELYKEKEEYDFNYVKEGIDMEGTHFSVLKDKYGLVHRLYEKLSSNQKNKEIPMKCRVNSIDKIQKALILQVIEDTNANCLETNIQKTNDITTIAWIDLNKVVSSIHAIVEKGLSYNFMVERIAEAKGNYYYVIVIDNKECWIKMLPFEIYQNTKKNIIRCEYRGVDSYGSHIFIEDKLSILYELYKED